MQVVVLISSIFFAVQVHSAGIYDEDDGSTVKVRDHDTNEWCYEQDHCKESSPSSSWQHGTCKTGNRQSPINILSTKVRRLVYPVKPLKTLDFSAVHQNYVMKDFQVMNNGHSIVLNKFVTETGTAPTFKWESRENGVYKLQQVHFHWGPDDNAGSEHKIDGKAFPIEMHMVHYRSDEGENGFSTFMDTAQSGKKDALAVIGIFLESGDNIAVSFLEPVVSMLGQISNKNAKAQGNSTLDLGQNLLYIHKAFHYMGSLTTPGCNEVVAWLVLPNPVKIAPKDLTAFRDVVKEGSIPLLHNYRSVQDNKEPIVRLAIK